MEEKISIGKDFINEAKSMVDYKKGLSEISLVRFLLRSAMAGIIIAFGYVIYILIDANFSTMILSDGSSLKPLGHFISSWLFGLCLVLIYYTKSELLTSNMMVLSVGNYHNRISGLNMIKIMTYTFIGNFLGGLFVGLLLAFSSILMSDTSLEYMRHVVEVKQSYTTSFVGIADLFVRAIWCNFFINLAMLIAYSKRIKSDMGKIFIMMAGVFFFMYMGLEHSIANTVFFTTAALMEMLNPAVNLGFDFSQAALNIFIVLIGNFIGGGILIGYYYSFINDTKNLKLSN